MDYKRHYKLLINRAITRQLEGYAERHHIIPRCLGGTDNPENLVYLTPEEHYVAHQLLTKMYPNNTRLLRAACMMVPNRPSNKLYGWLRRRLSEAQKRERVGKGNGKFGKTYIHNKKLKKCISIDKEDAIPVGWKVGRVILFDEPKVKCKMCDNYFERPRTSNAKYCSEVCKKSDTTPAVKFINENLDELIALFLTTRSVNKTLKSAGVTGRRAGNAYFCKILKERGIQLLRRRNSRLS